MKHLSDSEEIEFYRQESLRRLPAIYGDLLDDVKKQFNTEFGRHEALDRSFMISSNIQDFLTDHPYIVFRPECYKLAFQANELMMELYQVIGRSDFNQE